MGVRRKIRGARKLGRQGRERQAKRLLRRQTRARAGAGAFGGAAAELRQRLLGRPLADRDGDRLALAAANDVERDA